MLRVYWYSLATLCLLAACDHDDGEIRDYLRPPIPPDLAGPFPGPGPGPGGLPSGPATFGNCAADPRPEDAPGLRAFAACLTREIWNESGIEAAVRDTPVLTPTASQGCVNCHGQGMTLESTACGFGRSLFFKFYPGHPPVTLAANHELLFRTGASDFHPHYDYGPQSALYIAVDKLFTLTNQRRLQGDCR